MSSMIGPIVLIPGTEGAAHESFVGLQPLLARDYDVQLFDFRSDEDQTAERNFKGYVQQLQRVIADTGDGPVHLLGYSLGAHIALHAAADSYRVASLCLVGGWLKTDAFQRERHDLWLRLYDEQPELAGRLSNLLQFSPTYRSFLAEQQTAASLVPAVPTQETRRRVGVNRILDSTEAAKLIEIPTLLIAGTADMKVPVARSIELYGALKNSTLIRANSGHAILRERLGLVYGAYADFLQGAPHSEADVSNLVP